VPVTAAVVDGDGDGVEIVGTVAGFDGDGELDRCAGPPVQPATNVATTTATVNTRGLDVTSTF
jgi:hypothetical protein